MFIRNDAEAALSELAEHCAELSDHYVSSATRVHDGQLAEIFEGLAQQHVQLATELADHLRSMGNLPRAPDPDRETAVELLSAIRETLSSIAISSVLDDQIQREKRLAEEAEAALGHSLPEPARASVMKVAQAARSAQHRLAAAHA